jgi:hypothetical protein
VVEGRLRPATDGFVRGIGGEQGGPQWGDVGDKQTVRQCRTDSRLRVEQSGRGERVRGSSGPGAVAGVSRDLCGDASEGHGRSEEATKIRGPSTGQEVDGQGSPVASGWQPFDAPPNILRLLGTFKLEKIPVEDIKKSRDVTSQISSTVR